MIDLDISENAEKALQPASPLLVIFKERSNFGFVLRSVGIWDMRESFPRSFHIWWVILKDKRHSEHKQICPFFTTLD